MSGRGDRPKLSVVQVLSKSVVPAIQSHLLQPIVHYSVELYLPQPGQPHFTVRAPRCRCLENKYTIPHCPLDAEPPQRGLETSFSSLKVAEHRRNRPSGTFGRGNGQSQNEESERRSGTRGPAVSVAGVRVVEVVSGGTPISN